MSRKSKISRHENITASYLPKVFMYELVHNSAKKICPPFHFGILTAPQFTQNNFLIILQYYFTMRTLRILPIIICFSTYFSSVLLAQAPQYIEKYKTLAQKEMLRSGIPASIILGQAILESAAGTSELAKKSNNHFGIKATASWKGRTVQAQDDDPTPSMFRAYDNIEASYIDHTDHIKNSGKYDDLFKLGSTDYKGWANGLKKNGYATRADYAAALIRVIEENDLKKFDLPNSFSTNQQKKEDYIINMGANGAISGGEATKGTQKANTKGEVFIEVK
jgi:Mannosyl-glycoprotein endo-beta-N-acetylglucosaminidase